MAKQEESKVMRDTLADVVARLDAGEKFSADDIRRAVAERLAGQNLAAQTRGESRMAFLDGGTCGVWC